MWYLCTALLIGVLWVRAYAVRLKLECERKFTKPLLDPDGDYDVPQCAGYVNPYSGFTYDGKLPVDVQRFNDHLKAMKAQRQS